MVLLLVEHAPRLELIPLAGDDRGGDLSDEGPGEQRSDIVGLREHVPAGERGDESVACAVGAWRVWEGVGRCGVNVECGACGKVSGGSVARVGRWAASGRWRAVVGSGG